MAKNLELISDYYRYRIESKILTPIVTLEFLLGATLPPIPSAILVSLGFSMIGSYIGTFIKIKDELSTINEIQKIYDEIIRHYSKLNEVFDFNNPVEIFALYVYAVEKGYLSFHHNFEYGQTDDEAEKEILGLSGVEIILGHGVCRHFSGMLNDIFKESGVESKKCYVFSYDESKKNLYIPNHVIVVAKDDGVMYILDPTNSLIFKPGDSKSIYVSEDAYAYMSPFERLKLGKNLEFSSREDDENQMNKSIKICSENRDILKSFYKENKDLYEEIVQKKLSLQKYF